MAKDLKLVAVLEDRITAGLKAASQDWKREFEANANVGVKTTEEANRKIVASIDKAEKERIQMQQKTASIEEQMQAKRVQESNKIGLQLARAEYDLSRAIADQTVERFERLRLIEDAGHRLRLVKTGENNRLIELEMERHEAKLKAIELQEVDFPNKPFEKLLKGIGGLTGFRGGKEFSEKKEALGGILGAEEGAGSGAGGMAMGGMAAGIGVAAVAVVGLGIALEHTVEAAKELRKAEEGLESSFRTSGREETMSVDQLNKYAAALSNSTKFSEEQADAALAMIIPFRHISNEEIPQVLKMAAELSAKMGIDLPEAAGKLGMAFENPAKAAKMLKAAHVVLSDAETEQLKLWHKMGEDGKAHELLFKKLSESLGTYAEDTVHSTEIVGNQWHKLEGQMGQSFLKMADSISSGILKLEEWKKKLNDDPTRNSFASDRIEAEAKKQAKALNDANIAAAKAEEDRKRGVGIKEDPIDTQARITAAIKAEKQLAIATSKIADGEFIKRRQEEQARYELQKDASLGGNREDIAIEKIHSVNLEKIRDDEAKKLGEGARKSAENLEKLEAEISATRFALEKDSRDKDLAMENEFYTKSKENLHLSKQEKEAIEILHGLKVQEINQKFDEKAITDREAAEKKAAQKLQQEAALTAGLQEKLDATKGKNDPLAILEAQYKKEVILHGEKEKDKAIIDETYRIQKLNAERAQQEAELSAGAGFANNMAHLLTTLSGKNKALARTAMRVTEAGAIANTAGGIMKAFDQGGVLGFFTGAGIAAAGAAQVATIEQQLGKLGGYESGGYTGSGGRSDVAGIVHRGEMVWSQDDVRRAGGPQAADRIRTGNNSSTVHAPITINISGNADDRTVRQIGETLEQKLKSHAWMNKEIAYRNITA